MISESWSLAVELVASFIKTPARLSHLMERVPNDFDTGKRRACQSLLYGTVRHIRLLEKGLDGFLKKRPKPLVWASLLVASRELMENPEKGARIVNHAVEQVGRKYSPAEKGLVNAVLRKVPARLEELLKAPLQSPSDLAWRYSHPLWLVERWIEVFGWEDTLVLLEWNQLEPELYGRWQSGPVAGSAAVLSETPWEGFFGIRKEAWEQVMRWVEEGRFYIQNPGARVAPELLAKGFGGGRVLDLCCAPGGKALYLEALLQERVEEIVGLDLPGPRLDRFKANLQRYGSTRIRAVAGDLEEVNSETLGGQFEAVLVDVPCSNTGVLQRKFDALWRMDLESLAAVVELQRMFLLAASRLVAEGGWLVYSTCSIEEAENGKVVDAFLASDGGKSFRLEDSRVSLPWREGHDGSGAFLLKRM